MAGGYIWMICFYPRGRTADVCSSGYTSLYISLESKVTHDVPCFFEILLLDQSGKEKHQGAYFPRKYPPDITYCSHGPHQGLYYFFKRDSLYKSSKHYLEDDCVKIRCTIRVLNPHILKLPLNKVPDPINLTEFQQLVKTEGKKIRNVFFEVAGETYGAHRAILAVHSPAFRSTYGGNIVRPDTEPRILKALLWFVYTATLLEEEQDQEQESFMGKMLAAADQLGMERLKAIYESRILERVSDESVSSSRRCNATELKDTCLRFAAQNQAAVLETNGARYLEETCPSPESAGVTVTRPVEVCHEFVIKKYSSRRQGIGINESINSDKFMAGGYMWMICFYPRGRTADVCSSGYTSLYISLESKVSHHVPCFFEILLLDQSGKDKHEGAFFPNHRVYPPDITYCSHGPHQGLYYFFKRDSLYKSSNHYLEDDCVKIRCTIRVLNPHILKLPLNKVPDPINVTEFQQLVKTEGDKICNVFFEVAGETYGAHRAILAVHSPAFRSTYDGIGKDIVLRDTEPRILKALLWFVYTDTLLEEEQDQGQESFMGKMLAAADELGMERLKEIYETRMLERVSEETVAYLLHLAERCHATELKDACLRFAAENQAAVLETNGGRYLEEACPSLFLELAGYTEIEKPSSEIPSIDKESELDSRAKIVSVVKKYFGGMFSPYAYKKLKEA